MSSDHAGTNFPVNKLEPIQFNDESDFYQIISPMVSFPFLASVHSSPYAIRCVLRAENSATSTFPNLINFRVAKRHGFRRVFAHVAPIFFERGIAKPEAKVLCARSSDRSFSKLDAKHTISLLFMLAGSKEIYFHHYGRYNIDKIWRDDISPCRVYLRHCVLAAKNLGDEANSNFLDHTFLGDRKTTIHEYLTTTGAGIMEEEPPESRTTHYGG
ncbi:hypothetical protein CUMW_264100 [Citrus unshiu]|uniref:Uncharacterized protein n=1 Tax=Citrus unshiu TaxID=55188 RepID=A0A2H5QUX7_CITUN|nr:hypothetical protein CUMW_264100 [Citrus unshiu]